MPGLYKTPELEHNACAIKGTVRTVKTNIFIYVNTLAIWFLHITPDFIPIARLYPNCHVVGRAHNTNTPPELGFIIRL